MTTLIQIGNSKGVRIPKALIEQTNLADVELEFEVLPEKGLLLKPVVKQPRQDWENQICEAQAQYGEQADEGLLLDVLNHNDDANDWQW
jgi:antitoxin MazE